MEKYLTLKPAKGKFYGVAIGRQPGIYESWDDARKQITSFPGAMFKGFATKEEAETYCSTPVEPIEVPPPSGLAELNAEQRIAFDSIVSGSSIFITGPGGTGKSFLLQTVYANYKGYSGGKKICITAMTGCAALLLGALGQDTTFLGRNWTWAQPG